MVIRKWKKSKIRLIIWKTLAKHVQLVFTTGNKFVLKIIFAKFVRFIDALQRNIKWKKTEENDENVLILKKMQKNL